MYSNFQQLFYGFVSYMCAAGTKQILVHKPAPSLLSPIGQAFPCLQLHFGSCWLPFQPPLPSDHSLHPNTPLHHGPKHKAPFPNKGSHPSSSTPSFHKFPKPLAGRVLWCLFLSQGLALSGRVGTFTVHCPQNASILQPSPLC